jgi:pyruvate formate lyase activating enzyme
MAKWIGKELGVGTPLHFSRFRPQYRMRNLPPTPTETLDRARREAMDAGLEYVYVGNVFGHEGGSTYCPRDGTLLLKRVGYWISENNMTADGRCPVCREPIPGVWQ